MNLKYNYIGTPETKVIEECSELIHILCKVQRFGWFNWNPLNDVKIFNIDHVKYEINDLQRAIENLNIHMENLINEK